VIVSNCRNGLGRQKFARLVGLTPPLRKEPAGLRSAPVDLEALRRGIYGAWLVTGSARSASNP
jgi:hypothetical protein